MDEELTGTFRSAERKHHWTCGCKWWRHVRWRLLITWRVARYVRFHRRRHQDTRWCGSGWWCWWNVLVEILLLGWKQSLLASCKLRVACLSVATSLYSSAFSCDDGAAITWAQQLFPLQPPLSIQQQQMRTHREYTRTNNKSEPSRAECRLARLRSCCCEPRSRFDSPRAGEGAAWVLKNSTLGSTTQKQQARTQ